MDVDEKWGIYCCELGNGCDFSGGMGEERRFVDVILYEWCVWKGVVVGEWEDWGDKWWVR